MKTDENSIVKAYTVPLDVLMDILQIIFSNDLPNRIEGISVKENFIRLTVKFPPDHPFCNETKSNIEDILKYYGLYANGSPQDLEFGGSFQGQNDF